MKSKFTTILHETFPLFKYPNFLKLWGAQITGQTGVNMLHFVLIFQVFERTGNNFVVGLLVAILSLPSIFLSPIAGVFADSFNRRNILFLVNMARMVLTVLVLLSFKLPFVLILLALLITSVSQFFGPTEQSTIPEVVPKTMLMRANSFFTFSQYTTLLIGFTAAGPLLEYGGALVTLVVIGSLFGVATLLDRALPNIDKHIKRGRRRESIRARLRANRVWKNSLHGFKYVYRERVLMMIIVQVAFIFAVERAMIALVPALAQDMFGLSVAQISFFMITPLAIGTVFGVLLVNRLKSRKPLLPIIRIGLIIDAVTLLLIPLYQTMDTHVFSLVDERGVLSHAYIILLSLLSGLADVLIIVSAQTYIQKNVATETRGRVFATMFMMMNATGVPLVLLISLLADIVNVVNVLIIFGLATWVMVLWASWYFGKVSKLAKKAVMT